MSSSHRVPVAPGSLAIAFEEVLRIPAKLRTGAVPPDLKEFRRELDHRIRESGRVGESLGYERDYVGKGTYAVVALVDESILNSPSPALRDWARGTLQELYWGNNTAGETFFELLDELIATEDSNSLADVLEVFQMALLLGFRGRYGGDEEGLGALQERIRRRITRCRGGSAGLGTAWKLPSEEVPPPLPDPWVRRLAVTAGVALILVFGLFSLYSVLLNGAADRASALAAEVTTP